MQPPHAVPVHAWQAPFTQTWPEAHGRLASHTGHGAPAEQVVLHEVVLHTVHWPLRHAWPAGHWLIELHEPVHEAVVQAWQTPLLHTWPGAHWLFEVQVHAPFVPVLVQPELLHTPLTQ